MKQVELFAALEGDAWFRRNREHLSETGRSDHIVELLAGMDRSPGRTLEIGCSNGYRLHAIGQRFGVECVGIDVALSALLAGRTSHDKVTFVRGSVHSLPLVDSASFDTVIVNYVLHWVDRPFLLQSISEIDRVVRPSGILILGDFYPDKPSKTIYHHTQGQEAWTFKQSYGDIFTVSGLYRLIGLVSGSHEGPQLQAAICSHERVVTWVLEKDLEGIYESAH